MALDALINRKETSWFQQLLEAPCSNLAKTLYNQRQCIITRQTPGDESESSDDITVVCVSDTHNSQPRLPPGDILVHAGDLTQGGTAKELQAQLDWIDSQPHVHKIVIAGNHDVVLDEAKSAEFGFCPKDREALRWGSVTYLQRSSCSVQVRDRTVSIFGHPSTRKNGNWAFQHDRSADVFSDQIPDNIDILVTHSPPQFHGDLAGWGDAHLLREIWRAKPNLHVFGHIHAGYGRDILIYDSFERLYQRVRSGSAGTLALFQMMLLLFWMLVMGLDYNARRTILINAAAVGELREERTRIVQAVRI